MRPCWPAAPSFAPVVIIFPAVPAVTIFVVKIVIGLFPPTGEGVRGANQSVVLFPRYLVPISHAPALPAPPCRADMGMVLMMVVPGLEEPGAMPKMVDLAVAA